MHKNINEGHYFYKDEKTDGEYHYKLAFSILLYYKDRVIKKYKDLQRENIDYSSLTYPSILEIFDTFDIMTL